MKKKLIISLLTFFIVFPSVSFASTSSDAPVIPGYKLVTEEEEKAIEEENKDIDRGYVDEGIIYFPTEEQQKLSLQKKEENKSETKNTSNIGIMATEYPDGTTRIVNTTPYSNGTLIQQDTKQGTLSIIWNSSMYVAGKVFKTVGGIVLDLTNYYMDSLDKNRGSTSYTYKSYRYIGKDVQVYNGGGRWEVWYQAKSRQNYAHTYSSYVDANGYTKTRRLDYTADKGYSPIKTDYSSNYNNNSELQNRGWTNWYMNKMYYRSPEYGY